MSASQAGKSDPKTTAAQTRRPDHDRKDLLGTFPPHNICLPDASGRASPAGPRASPGVLANKPDQPHASPLYNVKHPRPLPREPSRITISTGPASTPTGETPEHAPNPKNGGARRDRTDDLKLAKLPLSQLSYGPLAKPRVDPWPQAPASEAIPKMVGLGRLERPTSPLSGVRSNHLSYRPGFAAQHLSGTARRRARARLKKCPEGERETKTAAISPSGA